MSRHVNLSSYEGVETLATFDDVSFGKYCKAKLASAQAHVDFLSTQLSLGQDARVCEIGSGNGRLLYALERAGMLSSGVGYEVSNTRHLFAQKFGAWLSSKQVVNKCSSVLDAPPEQNMDLVIGVDVVTCLIGPVAADAERGMTKWAFDSLKPGGRLVLELWDLSRRQRKIADDGGETRSFQEFPAEDPWEFVLETLRLDQNRDIVWNKLFLRRGSRERSVKEMVLRSYPKPRAEEMLRAAGFEGVRFFDAWRPDVPMVDGEYIVVASKPG